MKLLRIIGNRFINSPYTREDGAWVVHPSYLRDKNNNLIRRDLRIVRLLAMQDAYTLNERPVSCGTRFQL
jgi:hypothetical protein